MNNQTNANIVIIGGGVAGISCVESLFESYEPGSPIRRITLVSQSRLIKAITSYERITRRLERFEVQDSDIDVLSSKAPRGLDFTCITADVSLIDSTKKIVRYKSTDNTTHDLAYDILCLCNGARPRDLASICDVSEKARKRIYTIRDTESVAELKSKLVDCSQLAIIGNGGIGLESISKIKNCNKHWIVKDNHIGHTFLDAGASQFILKYRRSNSNEIDSENLDDNLTSQNQMGQNHGPSLGPSWSIQHKLHGSDPTSNNLEIYYRDEPLTVTVDESFDESKVSISTKLGKTINCDLIVSALGVTPNEIPMIGADFRKSSDNGVIIDTQMRTSVEDIYAAGDVVSCEEWPKTDLWFQMRLWTQARQMGYYAGRCMISHMKTIDPSIYFNFDCFAHCTSFFGYNIALLGRYNGRNTDSAEDARVEMILNVDPPQNYGKVLIEAGRILGVMLVGDNDEAETFENLIVNRTDVDNIKDHIFDLDDYFD